MPSKASKFFVSSPWQPRTQLHFISLGYRMGVGARQWETDEVPLAGTFLPYSFLPLGPLPLPKGLEPALFHGGQAAYLDGLWAVAPPSPWSLISLRKVLNLARGLKLNSAPDSRWNFFPPFFFSSLYLLNPLIRVGWQESCAGWALHKRT